MLKHVYLKLRNFISMRHHILTLELAEQFTPQVKVLSALFEQAVAGAPRAAGGHPEGQACPQQGLEDKHVRSLLVATTLRRAHLRQTQQVELVQRAVADLIGC